MALNYCKTLITIVILYTLTRVNAMKSWQSEKTWTFELKSFEGTSANADLINFFDMKIDRINRGIFAASGSFTINFDIVEGDSTEIEFALYRSENGVKDYHLTPFAVPRQHIYKYLDTYYKDLFMDTLSNCSNYPVFEDKFQPPIEKKTYTLNKCQFTQEGFPQYMQEGFYKVVMSGYGEVEWTVIAVAEVLGK